LSDKINRGVQCGTRLGRGKLKIGREYFPKKGGMGTGGLGKIRRKKRRKGASYRNQ